LTLSSLVLLQAPAEGDGSEHINESTCAEGDGGKTLEDGAGKLAEERCEESVVGVQA